MRKIKLPVLGEDNKTLILNYRDTLRNLLQYPSNPQMGFSIDEIRKSVKIISLLDNKDKDFLMLEESDYQFVLNRVKEHKFGIAHKYIINFVDDIENAESIKTKEDKK